MGKYFDAVRKNADMVRVGFQHVAGKASPEDFIKAIDESTAAITAVNPQVGAALAKCDEQVKKRLLGL
jgi:geranylgeranyl pyrophosphate synthase